MANLVRDKTRHTISTTRVGGSGTNRLAYRFPGIPWVDLPPVRPRAGGNYLLPAYTKSGARPPVAPLFLFGTASPKRRSTGRPRARRSRGHSRKVSALIDRIATEIPASAYIVELE
jgi:hypothetical protein